MKILLLIIIAVLFVASSSHGQIMDKKELFAKANEVFAEQEGTANSGENLIAGFSLGALLGGFIFSSIGFVAFMVGKKGSEFRPIFIGIALMGYPYFVRDTMAMFLIGIVLIVALFVWRE